jgi:hypothetical protein
MSQKVKPNFSPVSDPSLKPIVNQLTGFLSSMTFDNVDGVLGIEQGGTGTSTSFPPGSIIFVGAQGVYAQDNANLFWNDSSNELRVNALTAGSTTIGSSDGTYFIEIGANVPGNKFSFIDFHGDDTYTDNGLRIIRGNGGPNTNSAIEHRGTGSLYLTCNEGGSIILNTTSAVQLPKGTTAQRPTGTDGLIRFNTDTNRVEAFYSGIWNNL